MLSSLDFLDVKFFGSLDVIIVNYGTSNGIGVGSIPPDDRYLF